MKLLNRRISEILKSALLFSLLLGGGVRAAVQVSSDRFLLKVIDQTISLQDFNYQARNLKALNCIYDDSFVIQYFEKKFLNDWNLFLKNFPTGNEQVSRYMHQHVELLKKVRHFFKILRYADDQKLVVSPELTSLIQKSAKENKCDLDVLYNDTLKTNFLSLLRMELYFRSRYTGQLKNSSVSFNTVRPSIDLFVESLDKQFAHEYFW